MTESTGPAANYKEVGGGPLTSAELKTFLDCDFLLSIELGMWPESAASWPTRTRFWPDPRLMEMFHF